MTCFRCPGVRGNRSTTMAEEKPEKYAAGRKGKMGGILLKKRTKKLVITGVVVVGAVMAAAAGTLLYLNLREDTEQPEQLFTAYFRALSQQDYEAMYGQLSAESREAVDQERFVERNQKIYEGIEAENLEIFSEERREGEDGQVIIPYTISMDTVAGPLTLSNEAVYTEEEGEYRLEWTDAMIFADLTASDTVRVSRDEAGRGSIYDRNGVMLAGPGLASSVGLVPGKMAEDPTADLETLANLLGTTAEDIQEELDASWVQEDSFVPLKTMEKVYDTEIASGQADEETTALWQLQQQMLEIPGVMISDVEVRVYPLAEAASHLVGYVQNITAEELEEHAGEGYSASSVIGKSGLESLYETQLKGSDGYSISIVDENGETKEVIAALPKQDGEEIHLTIDAHLQQLLYDQMKDDKGTAAAIHPQTGEVLALLSTPGYDNNLFVRGMSQAEWDAISQDERSPMQNRFRAAWCPGSSLKPVTAAIGLNTGTLTAQEDLGADGDRWQKDASWGDYYVTTLHPCQNAVMEEAMILSDNIYFAKAALRIGADTLAGQLTALGFGEEMPFDFGLTASQYSNGEGFSSEIQLADSGYGQGQMLVNPLHMASIYSAFSNDGNMVLPYLIAGTETSWWKENVFTPEVAQAVEDMMVQVIENENGTGHGARIEGLALAGKTGTAEIKDSQDDTTGTELGWFNVYTTESENPVLLVSMIEDVKDRGGSGYVVDKIRQVLESYYQ